jgi:hypothetical protein
MRSERSFWTALKKRPLVTLKRPWPSLTNSVSVTAWLRAHQQHERHVNRPLKLQSAKCETCPAQYASSKRPLIMMGGCIAHRRLRSRLALKSLWRSIWPRLGNFRAIPRWRAAALVTWITLKLKLTLIARLNLNETSGQAQRHSFSELLHHRQPSIFCIPPWLLGQPDLCF